MSRFEQAVTITFALSGGDYGTAGERQAIFALEKRLEELLEAHALGELDGNEFGGGQAEIYCFGPDADRLYAWIESELRAFGARPATVVLRYGEASDPDAREQRISL